MKPVSISKRKYNEVVETNFNINAQKRKMKMDITKMYSSFRRIVQKSNCPIAIEEASKFLPKRID